MKTPIIFGTVLLSALSFAQVVIPNANENTAGSATVNIHVFPFAFRYQMLINASELTGMVGRTFNGISWRQRPGAAIPWPPSVQSWADYEIRIGVGVAPSAGSTTLANNFVGTPTLARDGLLTIATGDFGIGTPASWGSVIPFQTNFLYSGGHLIIDVAHGNATLNSTPLMDAVPAGGTGWGTSYRSYRGTSNSQTAPMGQDIPFAITRLTTLEVFLSGTATLLDIAAEPTGRTLEIEIRNVGSTVPIESRSAILSSSGDFATAITTPPGTYDVSFKASHWLRKTLTNVVITSTGVSGILPSLANGDCDNDNEVTLVDFAQLSAAFGSIEGDPNWDVNADLDIDGEVSLVDFSILSSNFGSAGDE